MENNHRIKAVAAIDIFVALSIFVVGVIVLLFGLSWSDYVSFTLSLQGTQNIGYFKWANYTVWIVYFLGFTVILYAVKRFVDNILRLIIKNGATK